MMMECWHLWIFEFSQENHSIAIFHGKTMIFWISMENPNYFWISMENPKQFGFLSMKIQKIFWIFLYPQKVHSIIGLPL